MKTIKSLLYFILIMIVFTPAVYANESPETIISKVTYVYDGDTVFIENIGKVRLLGINCPEKGKPLYNEAKSFVMDLVLGKTVKVEICPVRTKDKYNRTRAIIYFKHGNYYENLNTKLLRKGFAVVWSIPPCHIDVLKWKKYEL